MLPSAAASEEHWPPVSPQPPLTSPPVIRGRSTSPLQLDRANALPTRREGDGGAQNGNGNGQTLHSDLLTSQRSSGASTSTVGSHMAIIGVNSTDLSTTPETWIHFRAIMDQLVLRGDPHRAVQIYKSNPDRYIKICKTVVKARRRALLYNETRPKGRLMLRDLYPADDPAERYCFDRESDDEITKRMEWQRDHPTEEYKPSEQDNEKRIVEPPPPPEYDSLGRRRHYYLTLAPGNSDGLSDITVGDDVCRAFGNRVFVKPYGHLHRYKENRIPGVEYWCGQAFAADIDPTDAAALEPTVDPLAELESKQDENVDPKSTAASSETRTSAEDETYHTDDGIEIGEHSRQEDLESVGLGTAYPKPRRRPQAPRKEGGGDPHYTAFQYRRRAPTTHESHRNSKVRKAALDALAKIRAATAAATPAGATPEVVAAAAAATTALLAPAAAASVTPAIARLRKPKGDPSSSDDDDYSGSSSHSDSDGRGRRRRRRTSTERRAHERSYRDGHRRRETKLERIPLKDIPLFDPIVTTPAAHLRNLALFHSTQYIPEKQWPQVLIYSVNRLPHTMSTLSSIHPREGESHADHYKRLVDSFKKQHTPNEALAVVLRGELHKLHKNPDTENIQIYAARFMGAVEKARPDFKEGEMYFEKERRMMLLENIEEDVKKECWARGLQTDWQTPWHEWLGKIEALYLTRHTENAMPANRRQRELVHKSDGARPEITSTGNLQLQTLIPHVDVHGRQVFVSQAARDPFQSPSFSTYGQVLPVSYAPAAAAAASTVAVPPQHPPRRRGQGRSRKREHSPSRSPERPSRDHSSRPHRSNPAAVKQEHPAKEARTERSRLRSSHPSRQGSRPAHMSSANATSLNRDASHSAVDTTTAGFKIYGPCKEPGGDHRCGLNHSWDYCYRNPKSPKFKEEHRDFKGPSPTAAKPGYKLGDEIKEKGRRD